MKKLLLALTLLTSLSVLSAQNLSEQEPSQQQQQLQPSEQVQHRSHSSQRKVYYYDVQKDLVECSKILVDMSQRNNDECQEELNSFYEAGATSREAIDAVKLGIEIGINERTKIDDKPSFSEIVEIISLQDEV